jgi:hypothetical protein
MTAEQLEIPVHGHHIGPEQRHLMIAQVLQQGNQVRISQNKPRLERLVNDCGTSGNTGAWPPHK